MNNNNNNNSPRTFAMDVGIEKWWQQSNLEPTASGPEMLNGSSSRFKMDLERFDLIYSLTC